MIAALKVETLTTWMVRMMEVSAVSLLMVVVELLGQSIVSLSVHSAILKAKMKKTPQNVTSSLVVNVTATMHALTLGVLLKTDLNIYCHQQYKKFFRQL